MNNRPRSGSNGSNGRGVNRVPYNGSRAASVMERDRPRTALIGAQRRRSLSLLSAALICLALGLGLGIFAVRTLQLSSWLTPEHSSENFRWAVNKATNAAELTQVARSRQEWQTVADWWQEAIELMQSVSVRDSNYKVAQQRVSEYQRNLAYAQQKVRAAAPASPAPSPRLWGFGSFKADILQVQGKPSRVVRYDALCQEVLHYGNSTVELENGIAISIHNADRNLKAIDVKPTLDNPGKTPVIPADPNRTSWTLGSEKQEVFRIQGTPSRITPYEAIHQEVLDFNGSSVELSHGRVVGYNNLRNNLRVAIGSVALDQRPLSEYWSIGSERNDVFRVQGTPTQISFDSQLCREVLTYGESTIELKNGVVNGYDNSAKNLRVKTK